MACERIEKGKWTEDVMQAKGRRLFAEAPAHVGCTLEERDRVSCSREYLHKALGFSEAVNIELYLESAISMIYCPGDISRVV